MKSSLIKFNSPLFFLGMATAVLLFVGIADFPYGYYQFLRIVVSISAIILAYKYYSKETKFYPIILLFVGIAILFNPIVPIHMDKSVWIIFDAIIGGIFFIEAFIRAKKVGT